MKIARAGDKSRTVGKGYNNRIQKSGEFSSTLDMAKKDQSEEELRQMFKDIDRLGKRLESTKALGDAKEYKKKIQEYISFIVKNIYSLKVESSPFNFGIHVRIDVINKKLDELTKELIDEQKETLELADRIEEIKGLLLDIYK